MAPTIEREPDTGPYKFLAKTVTSNKEKSVLLTESLFVDCPQLADHTFHTYGANDLHKPEYFKDVESFGRDEYVYLVYEESDYTDGKYTLQQVEPAKFTHPTDYETMGESDLPKTCPMCGDDAVAVLKEDDQFGRAYADDATTCTISNGRGEWFDMRDDRVYVHR